MCKASILVRSMALFVTVTNLSKVKSRFFEITSQLEHLRTHRCVSRERVTWHACEGRAGLL